MDEWNIEIAKLNARLNYDRLTACLPANLVKKEDGLFEGFLKSHRSPHKKLKELYEFMDELYAFVGKFTPCKKSCSDCCYYNVTISDVEIAHIEKAIGIKRLMTSLPKRDFHGEPCPLLKEGAWVIYKARPFVCRRHVTLCKTPVWCHRDRCNTDVFPLLSFSEINKSMDLIIRESGQTKIMDIRQVFERV